MTSGVLDFGNRRRWDEFTGQHDSGVFLFAFDMVFGFPGDSLATTNVCIAMEFYTIRVWRRDDQRAAGLLSVFAFCIPRLLLLLDETETVI